MPYVPYVTGEATGYIWLATLSVTAAVAAGAATYYALGWRDERRQRKNKATALISHDTTVTEGRRERS